MSKKLYDCQRCDYCGKKAIYDGKTNEGPWAYMCYGCFKKHGSKVPGLHSILEVLEKRLEDGTVVEAEEKGMLLPVGDEHTPHYKDTLAYKYDHGELAPDSIQD